MLIMEEQEKKKAKNHLITLLLMAFYLLAVLISFRKVLFTEGVLGLHDDWAIPPLRAQYLGLVNNLKSSWSVPYLGWLEMRSLADYLTPLWAISARLFNLNGEFFSKHLYIFFIFLSGVFFYLFSRKNLKISRLASWFGGFIYMLSPIIFNSVVTGYLILILSYAFLPLFFLIYTEVLTEEKLNLKKIVSAGLVLRVVFSQDFFILIAGILAFSYFVFETIITNKSFKIKAINFFQSFLILLIALLLTGPFFLVTLGNFTETSSFAKEQVISWNTYVMPNLFRAFSLDGAGYRYFLDSIPKSIFGLWNLINFSIVMVIFSSVLIVSAKDKKTALYFELLALATVFIFKGVNPPFGQIYNYLIDHFSMVMVLIRNVQYITVLTSFAYAVLFGFFIDWFLFRKKLGKKLAGAFTILTIAFLIINVNPFFSGDYQGGIQNIRFDKSYEVLDDQLRKDQLLYRVYWLPPMQPLAYKDSKHAGNDPFVYGWSKPYLGNGSPKPIMWVLAKNFYTGENPNLRNLLAFMSIKKIIYRDDFSSRWLNFVGPDLYYLHKYWNNESLKKTLANIDKVELKETIGKPIEVYENNYFLPYFYIPHNLILLVSDVEGLATIGSLGDYQIRSAVFVQDKNEDQSSVKNLVNEIIIKAEQLKESELSYVAEIPEEGEYQILINDLRQNSFNSSWIELDGEKIFLKKGNIEPDGWWRPPKKYFNKGKIKIYLDFANWRKAPTVLLRMKKNDQVPADTPKTIFVKINPTKYRVKVTGAKDPYTLVFSENYHQGWKAYINQTKNSKINPFDHYGGILASYFNGEVKEGSHKNIFFLSNFFETWGKKALPEERHGLVNSFANSWYIKPEDSGGKQDYEIIIELLPQRFFAFGLFTALMTLIVCFIVLLSPPFKRIIIKQRIR